MISYNEFFTVSFAFIIKSRGVSTASRIAIEAFIVVQEPVTKRKSRREIDTGNGKPISSTFITILRCISIYDLIIYTITILPPQFN
jgi:hypothetical protein